MVFSKRFIGLGQHAFNQTDQRGFVEWLLDEIHRTFFHGVNRHGHVAVTGDEHDGQG